jgi:hypothetical protein
LIGIVHQPLNEMSMTSLNTRQIPSNAIKPSLPAKITVNCWEMVENLVNTKR